MSLRNGYNDASPTKIKIPLYSPTVNLFFQPRPKTTSDLLFVSMILPFLECHVNNVLSFMSVFLQFEYFGIPSMCSACISRSSHGLTKQWSIVWIYNNLFTYLLAYEYISCFQFGAIKNNVAMTICIRCLCVDMCFHSWLSS